MIARQDLAESFQRPGSGNFAHGHTCAGHPVACAAGIAVIDEIVEKGLARRARDLGERLAKGLERL